MHIRSEVQKLFVKEKSGDLKLFYEEFLKSINLIIGFDQLLENFLARLKELLNSDSLYLILYEPITDRFIGKRARGNNIGMLSDFNFFKHDNLIKWLNVNHCVLNVESEIEVIRFLSEKERDLLKKTDIVLVVPFIVVNRLTGALFVSRKLTGQGYNKFETETLLKLSSQVALALEHSLLYQFQEDKIKKILHTDKLATIGEIAAGIAHEIRNPLTSIRSTVQYLKNDIPSEKQKLIIGVIEEVDRIDQIIKGLLSFSRTSDLKMEKVDIIEILDQTLLLIEPEMQKKKIHVERDCKASDTIIMGDASQLKQVFLNVLLNSIQSISADGKIQINLQPEPKKDSIHGKNNLLCIIIKDNGKGIHENEINKVFDPFYTTKETGTGLGLSISYGIIKKHGGEIEIESKTEPPYNGTLVTIRLPRK